MSKIKLNFHFDAGHGWLAVPKSIKLASRYASPYSYQDRENYYLEEDSDAPKFLEAFKFYNPLTQIEIIQVNDGDASHIRQL